MIVAPGIAEVVFGSGAECAGEAFAIHVDLLIAFLAPHGTWLVGCILIPIGGILVPVAYFAGAYGAFSASDRQNTGTDQVREPLPLFRTQERVDLPQGIDQRVANFRGALNASFAAIRPVGEVDGTVGTVLQLQAPEPGVVCRQEVGLMARDIP